MSLHLNMFILSTYNRNKIEQVVTSTFYIVACTKYINPSKKAQRFYDVNPDSIMFSNLNMKLILEKGRLYFPRQLRANSIQRRICEKVKGIICSSSNVFILYVYLYLINQVPYHRPTLAIQLI